MINTNGQKYRPICRQFGEAAIKRTVWYKTKLMMTLMKELPPEIRYTTKFCNSKSELGMFNRLQFYVLYMDFSKGERLMRT